MEMKRIVRTKSFWLSVCVCLLPIVVSAVLYNRLPNEVATHFGADFKPDGYSPKWMAAFLMPGILLCLNVLVWFMTENDPRKAGINKNMKLLSHWIVPVISIIVQAVVIFHALGGGIGIVRIIPVLVGLILVIAGNYMPKCRRNYTTGIKLPWTLHDDENWNKTHRLGGRLMVLCGFAIMLCGFFEVRAEVVVGMVLLTVIIPAVYSYTLYRRGINQE